MQKWHKAEGEATAERHRMFATAILSENRHCPHAGGGGGKGVLDIMHGRSRMTTDPLIRTMPMGRRRGGVHSILFMSAVV